MVQINFAQKEIQCKIVYYGPGMSGKTTNLELVHGKVPDEHRGELTSIATTGERTLYFDYMPLDLGQIAGIRTKFQLYTVPGQIYYKSTRRLVLQGVDGIVFVADSSRAKLRENKESLADLEENLREMGKETSDLPIIIQYNKRDLPDAMSVEELEAELNTAGFPHTEAVATRGDGVFPTLKQLAGLVLEAVNKGGLATARPKAAPRPAKVTRPEGGMAAEDRPAQGRTAPKAPQPPKAPQTPPRRAPMPARSGTAVARSPARVQAPAAQQKQPARSGLRPTGSAGARPVTRSAAAPPAPTLQQRAVQDRVVQVSGLPGRGPNKLVVLLALGALIAGAAYFVLMKM